MIMSIWSFHRPFRHDQHRPCTALPAPVIVIIRMHGRWRHPPLAEGLFDLRALPVKCRIAVRVRYHGRDGSGPGERSPTG
jgi:hypothetical protein